MARLLSLMGVVQTITVRAAADAGSHAEGGDYDQDPVRLTCFALLTLRQAARR